MKTGLSGRFHNSERMQSIQVRRSAVRFRGSLSVNVASVAAPSARSSEPATHSFEQPSSWDIVHPHNPANIAAPGNVAPLPTLVVSDTTSLSSEDVAKLERAASSGLATTSSFVESPSPANYRRRFSNPVGKATSTAMTSGVEGKASSFRGNALRFLQSREFQPREFTSHLAGASSIEELHQLFEMGRNHEMNAIHIATLWTRLAKLVSASSAAAARTSAATASGSPASQPGRAGPAAAQGVHPAVLMSFIGSLEAVTTAEQLADMAPRGLANLVWAAAKLKPEAATASSSSSSFASEMSSSGSSSVNSSSSGLEEARGEISEATDGEPERPLVGVSQRPLEDSSSGPRRQRRLSVRGGKTALAATAAAEAEAAKAEAAATSNRLSSTVVSESLLDAWATAAGSKLSEFNMQDISNVVWALGRLGYQPLGMFMTRLSIALLKELPRAGRPQQVSNVLLGLALLRFTPPIKDFWPRVWDAVQRLVLVDQRDKPDVQGVTNTLWALSHLTNECPNSMAPVPAPLVSKAVFRAVQYGEHLTGQQCQDVFISLPRLGFEPSEYQASKLLSLAKRVMPSCDGQALSNILVALVQLKVQPWYTWKIAALEAFEKQLPYSTPEAIARFLFAWAHMRMPPPVWASQVWDKLHGEVHNLTATDIAFVVLGANQQFERLPRRAKDAAQQMQGTDAAGTTEAATDSPASTSAAASEAAEQVTSDVVRQPRRRRGVKASGGENGVKVRVPPRQFLLALRDRWETVGPEAQLKVVFAYRSLVQEFFDSL